MSGIHMIKNEEDYFILRYSCALELHVRNSSRDVRRDTVIRVKFRRTFAVMADETENRVIFDEDFKTFR